MTVDSPEGASRRLCRFPLDRHVNLTREGVAVRIGVPKETRPGETRVAATPKTVAQLIALGYDVLVESGAGALASFTDHAYEQGGASVAPAEQVWGADIIVKINAPSEPEIARLRAGTTVASLLSPALAPELLERLSTQGVTALAMDAVPRISRAQSLDVLSSMANIAGYRAVIEAAHEFGSLFTGQITAAGKVPPAKVLVVGAGVAGLAAPAPTTRTLAGGTLPAAVIWPVKRLPNSWAASMTAR